MSPVAASVPTCACAVPRVGLLVAAQRWRATPHDQLICLRCMGVWAGSVGSGTFSRWAPVTGRTFDVKDHLKRLGARWFPAQRVWIIEETKLSQAQKIVMMGPSGANAVFGPAGPAVAPQRPAASSAFCWECGGPLVTRPGSSVAGRYCGCSDDD